MPLPPVLKAVAADTHAALRTVRADDGVVHPLVTQVWRLNQLFNGVLGCIRLEAAAQKQDLAPFISELVDGRVLAAWSSVSALFRKYSASAPTQDGVFATLKTGFAAPTVS